MAKYKLTIVEEKLLSAPGAKHPLRTYRELSTIGYFDTEAELKHWAEENIGELGKNFEDTNG